MRLYLSPLQHRGNYTSFGRHFTEPEIIDAVAELTVQVMKDGDMLADMCCGPNTFVPAVKNLGKARKIQVMS